MVKACEFSQEVRDFYHACAVGPIWGDYSFHAHEFFWQQVICLLELGAHIVGQVCPDAE